MDKAERIWLENKDKEPKDRLSMRTTADECELLKTTVKERLSRYRKGHGHIAGGRDSPESSQKVSKWVTKQVKITITVTILADLARKLASRSWLWKLVPPFTAYYWVWFWHFLTEQEDELEELLMGYARRGFPFSDDKFCMLAYELTVKTHRPRFSPTKKRAGRAWRKGFMERKPWMRKKNAQNLSAARVMAVNPVQVEKFFQLLKKWVRDLEIEFKANHIWNVDETGISDVPKERKVIGITRE